MSGERVAWSVEVVARNHIGPSHPNHPDNATGTNGDTTMPAPEFVGDTEIYVMKAPQRNDITEAAKEVFPPCPQDSDEFPHGFSSGVMQCLYLRKGLRIF